ncbi:CARDB domain-containing protein [Nocardioides sp. L-11A]|uniref:CARDB domain-containing protein n=1 Tax=Nocardioides sp. L-11A TaxID=3043848 RepID=UPI00249C5D7C|nr:CARDB domain-containing protein [Nocardioides sp. L-11A]
MQARRTAILTATTVLGASLATLGTTPGASAAPQRADLVVSALSTPPTTVRHGSSFNLGATVANKGRASAKRSSLRFYLSRDRVRSADDIVGGSVAVKRIKPRKKKTVSGPVHVPVTAAGKYWVLACADATTKVKETKERNNCRVSRSQVDVDAALHAALVGRLTFLDEGERTDPTTGRVETWRHTASASISMAVDGDPHNPTFASTGSTYERAGSVTALEESDNCRIALDRTEAGGGTLAYAGDRFNDDINARFTRTDLSGLRVGLSLRADWSATSTRTGRGQFPCDPSTTTTEGTVLDISSIELTQVAATAGGITYRVVGWVGEQNTPSDWDRVEGTLTLTSR